MSRFDEDRLEDIAEAIAAIRSHLELGPISVEIVMDAVAMRLLEIGEAVKRLSPESTEAQPEIPWSNIAGLRDVLAHHYFASNAEIIQAIIDKDLEPLADAVARLRARIDER